MISTTLCSPPFHVSTIPCSYVLSLPSHASYSSWLIQSLGFSLLYGIRGMIFFWLDYTTATSLPSLLLSIMELSSVARWSPKKFIYFRDLHALTALLLGTHLVISKTGTFPACLRIMSPHLLYLLVFSANSTQAIVSLATYLDLLLNFQQHFLCQAGHVYPPP